MGAKRGRACAAEAVRSSTYLNEFLGLRAAPLLLSGSLWPRGREAKEITESMTAWHAVRAQLPHDAPGRRDVVMVDVGCGIAPRTASVFAACSRWHCIAVDPLLRKRAHMNRVECRPVRIEQTRVEHDGLVVVAAVHSHAPLPAVVEAIKAPEVLLVSIPCCVRQELPQQPDAIYEDRHCWSGRREVRVWSLRQ